MAEEQSPQAQPTEKRTRYTPQVGDYYAAGGAIYVYEFKFGPRPSDGKIGGYMDLVRYPQQELVPKEKLKRFAPQSMPMTVAEQNLYNVPIADRAVIAEELERNFGKNKIYLGQMSTRSRPTEATVYRYPVAEGDQGGIDANADYVVFDLSLIHI